MTQNYPPFAVFPDLNCILRRPTGAEYRGKLRQHPSTEVDTEHWYEGYLRAELKDHVTADTTLKDRFSRDGLRPDRRRSGWRTTRPCSPPITTKTTCTCTSWSTP